MKLPRRMKIPKMHDGLSRDERKALKPSGKPPPPPQEAPQETSNNRLDNPS